MILRPVIEKGLIQPILRSPLGSPLERRASVNSSGLYRQMVDTTQPLPMFFQGWTTNVFNGVSNTAPPAVGAPLDSEGESIVEFTVSGSAGATSMTYSAGNAAYAGTGAWGGCIQHDDGTYGLYTISGLTGGSFNIQPPLRATCTNRTLSNMEGVVNGQHIREPSLKAMARAIMNQRVREVYRNRYADKWIANNGVASDWASVNGGYREHVFQTNQVASRAYRAVGRRMLNGSPGAPYTGKGISRTFSLNGNSGVMEAFVSCSFETTSTFASFRVQLVVDGVTIHNSVIPAEAGLQRILIDYPSGSSATLTLTRNAEETNRHDIRVGDVTFWSYDRSLNLSDYAIGKDEKVVVFGTSWTTRYNAVLGAEIQAVQAERGGTGSVVSVGQAGSTTSWGLTAFDDRVPQHNPDVVLLNFYINDMNSLGDANYEIWLKNLYSLARKVQALGARPYIVMPQPTASASQAALLGEWNARLGLGVPL